MIFICFLKIAAIIICLFSINYYAMDEQSVVVELDAAAQATCNIVQDGVLDLSKSNLSGNFTRSVLPEVIPHSDRITKLILRDNCIERFDLKSLLELMPRLSHIDVSYNQITKLRRSMLEGLPSGCYASFSDNPIAKLGSGVMAAIAGLRDKSVRISMHRTALDVEVLESMEHLLSRISSQHLATKIGLMILGGLMLPASIVMKVYATSNPESWSSNMTSSSIAVATQSNPILDGFAVVAFIAAPICFVAGQVAGIFQHDTRESILYWYLLP